jgi:hypothetical protein
MIDAISNTINLAVVWQYVGPLLGVGFGYLISDKVWNRQRQWEMRRDAISEAVRALGELEHALIDLHSSYSFPNSFPGSKLEDLKTYTATMRHDKRTHFEECNTKYYRAMFVTDLIGGNQLKKQLSEYFQATGKAAALILHGDTSHFDIEMKKELAEKGKAVIEAARKELNIKVAS